MSIFNRFQTFATNGTVDAASLHNLIDATTIRQGLITSSANTTSVGTNYELLIADMTNANANPNAVTVYDLFQDALTAGTYTNANISEALTYGTATGTRLVSTNATITTGTITTGVIPTLTSSTATFGTTISTAATITSGTVTNLASTTGTIATLVASAGTFAGSLVNVTTGTIGTLNSTTGTIGTLNSTTGTIGTLNSTTGTISTLNSTTGTITNLSTTLAGDFTISQGTGTIGTAKVTPTNLSQPFTSATAVASTSGTAIDFTSIPIWVKRITVMFGGVSTNGTSTPWLIQLGDSGGIETTGYLSASGRIAVASASAVNSTEGFSINVNDAATNTIHGSMTITLIDLSNNSWAASGAFADSTVQGSIPAAGSKSLSATLNRVRITTSGGSNTFDAGSVNIMYEG